MLCKLLKKEIKNLINTLEDWSKILLNFLTVYGWNRSSPVCHIQLFPHTGGYVFTRRTSTVEKLWQKDEDFPKTGVLRIPLTMRLRTSYWPRDSASGLRTRSIPENWITETQKSADGSEYNSATRTAASSCPSTKLGEQCLRLYATRFQNWRHGSRRRPLSPPRHSNRPLASPRKDAKGSN